MGYPINNYSLLKSFIKKDVGTLKNFFKADFALYGFLVHDPQNTNFNLKLQESFFKLHLATRNDLLFTAFVDPPESWIEWVNKKEINFGEFYNSEQLHNPQNIIKTFNPSMVSNFICQYLNIPAHKLPFLIISDDLSKPGYYVVELNADGLMDAIMGLCEFNYYKADMNLDTFFENIYSHTRVNKITSESSLANTLLKLSAILYELSSDNELNKRVANVLISAQETELNSFNKDSELGLIFDGLRRLQDKASKNLYFPSEYSDVLTSKDDTVSERQISYCSFKKNTPQRRINFNEETFALLERGSQLLLLQGIKLYDKYDDEFDSSVHIFPFVKAFETELTYSLTHWVREQYNIELPPFFYEFEPGKYAVVNIGRGVNIDFNKKKNQQWACPELGGQLAGFKTTRKLSLLHPFSSDELCNSFLDISFSLKNIRNRAIHPSFLGKKELDQVVNYWEDLLNNDYFKELYSLKIKYKGG